MKILHVIPSVSLKHGGPSVMIRLVERALREAGVDVTTVTTNDDGPLCRLSVPLEQPNTEENATRWYFQKQSEFYKFSWRLERWLSKNITNFDVVHVHALFSFSSTAAMWHARRSQVPYVVRPLGVLNQHGRARRPVLKRLSFTTIEGPLLSNCAALHYTSEQEQIETEQINVPKRGHVIPVPIDIGLYQPRPSSTQFFSRWPEAKGREIILFLSRLNEVKGLDVLLHAFAEAKKAVPALFLVIAGDGEPSFVHAMHREAEKLGLHQDLIWTGFLAEKEKLSALSAATIFALPSRSESFGIAAAEALAAGCATILGEGVAIARDARHSNAAIVVPNDAQALVKALLLLQRDEGLRLRLRANAESFAAERFSLDTVGRRLVALYESILTST